MADPDVAAVRPPESPVFKVGAPAVPFGSVLVPGRFGSFGPRAGLFLVPMMVGSVQTVTARRGRLPELLTMLSDRLGFPVENRAGVWATPRRRVIGVAPGRFLICGFDRADEVLLDPLAYRVAQDGSVAILRAAGPHLADVMAKGVAIDLHPSVFRPGSAAVTTLEHMPVTVTRLSDILGHPVYDLITGRSHARGLARWLMEAGAPWGVEIYRLEADLAAGGGFFAAPRSRA